MKKLKLGLPKGSLQESTFELFRKAGYRISSNDRSYFPVCDDEELDIMLIRSQEIPRYVQDGMLDAGLTGYDWIRESRVVVQEVAELVYAKSGYRPVRWVVAVPASSGIRTVRDLAGKKIATELVHVVEEYLAGKKVRAQVEFSWGATEAKTPYLVDAIVELTETGSSLRANKLSIIDEVLVSTTRLIANTRVWNKNAWKREKINSLALMLGSALRAEGMVGLKMNIREKDITRVTALLPSLKQPTIARLTMCGWVAVEVIVEERVVKRIIPDLKRIGAEGIFEYPLNKLIP